MAKNKYAKGKIYKLVNTVDDNVYVGSTYRGLGVRYADHVCASRRERFKSMEVYKHMSQIGWENVSIVLVEKWPCTSLQELTTRERYWIETLKPTLNTRIPTRTDAEYRADNKQRKRDKQKLYRENNKAMIAEKAKAYYEQNRETLLPRRNEKICCECGCMVSKYTLDKHKAKNKHKQRMLSMETEPTASGNA